MLYNKVLFQSDGKLCYISYNELLFNYHINITTLCKDLAIKHYIESWLKSGGYNTQIKFIGKLDELEFQVNLEYLDFDIIIDEQKKNF